MLYSSSKHSHQLLRICRQTWLNILNICNNYCCPQCINLNHYLSGWLGAMSTSMSLFISPLVIGLCRRKSTRLTAVMGGLITALGCLFTSFASQFHQLFFSYGMMIGKICIWIFSCLFLTFIRCVLICILNRCYFLCGHVKLKVKCLSNLFHIRSKLLFFIHYLRLCSR